MCFVSKKKLEKLQKGLDELTSIVKTREFDRLKKESQDLKQIRELLSYIKFKVKDVKVFDGEELGTREVKITYQLPTITLMLDDNGEPNKDDFFYATNMLNMISIKDMEKIQDVLSKEKFKINTK